MSDFEQSEMLEALAALSRWLIEDKIPYAIIGGVAISLLTEPRATKDIDVTVWQEEISNQTMLESAAAFGFGSRIENAVDFASQARILLLKHTSGVTVDLSLGALPFEKHMIDHSQTYTIGSMQVQIASPEDLIISKAVPMRPIDLADIDKLLSFYPDVNFVRIRELVSEFQLLLDRPEYLQKLDDVFRRHKPK
jgi:hypothetical protein